MYQIIQKFNKILMSFSQTSFVEINRAKLLKHLLKTLMELAKFSNNLGFDEGDYDNIKIVYLRAIVYKQSFIFNK